MRFNRYWRRREVLLKVLAGCACVLQGCASAPEAPPAPGQPRTVVYCESRFARNGDPAPLASRIPCLKVY